MFIECFSFLVSFWGVRKPLPKTPHNIPEHHSIPTSTSASLTSLPSMPSTTLHSSQTLILSQHLACAQGSPLSGTPFSLFCTRQTLLIQLICHLLSETFPAFQGVRWHNFLVPLVYSCLSDVTLLTSYCHCWKCWSVLVNTCAQGQELYLIYFHLLGN
jgi:hypothetical protein